MIDKIISQVLRLSNDPQWNVRCSVVSTLLELGRETNSEDKKKQIINTMLKLAADPHPTVRKNEASALKKITDFDIMEYSDNDFIRSLIEHCDDELWEIRLFAARELEYLCDKIPVEFIEEVARKLKLMSEDENYHVRESAKIALERIQEARFIEI